ncbi:MAG: ParA family protein [Erysipelotrichaceae bacterium]|nr:ParA family protein [Erysipelotrichaceae bacterium]
MTRIISINNRKGGSSKTTTAINLAYEFARSGYRTLLIDLDPQGNASSKFVEEYETVYGIAEVLAKKIDINYAIHETSASSNLYVIPSKIELDDVAEYMQGNSQIAMLSKVLKDLKDDYQIIVLDSNPGIPILLKNCVYAADLIIIPVNVDRNSIKGVDLTLKKINETIFDSPSELDVDYRILISMVTYSSGEPTNIAKGVLKAVKDAYKDKVLQTTIRLQSKPAQLQTFENGYYATDFDTGYGCDYRKLKEEIKDLIEPGHCPTLEAN